MDPKIVFMGSPQFAVPILQIIANKYQVVGVITQPDRPAGRGKLLQFPPIKKTAQELSLEVFQPEKMSIPESLAKVKDWNPDLIIVAAYGQILKNDILKIPKYGCINIHPSLLPRWRGASPIQAAILSGDTTTGVTIMKMDEGMDTGPIYVSEPVFIHEDDTGESLGIHLSIIGARLLDDSLLSILSGRIVATPQDINSVTHCKSVKKEHGKLNLNEDAQILERQIRAYHPWPGSVLNIEGVYIKVIKARVGKAMHHAPGSRFVYDGFPEICTASGSLVLEILQPAGKKSMTGKQFLQGCRYW